ncbi:hypothetical protein Tco_0795841 [Tanacetum coccineum]
MERAATTAASLDVEHDSSNILRIQSMATLNEPVPQGTSSGVKTLRNREDRLKIMELMEICIKLPDRVLALENIKTTLDLEITSLKMRLKKNEIGQDEEISWFQEDEETQGSAPVTTAGVPVTTASTPITTAGVSISTVEPSTPLTTTILLEDEDLTIAQTLMKMITMMEADYELAHRLQAKEQGELTIEERSKLFVELMDKRKKHFAKLRAEEIRRKPPTKAQKRNQMSTYLRNMAGYKHTQLKGKSYKEIQMLFDKEIKRVNTFVAMDSEVVESIRKEAVSKKRAGEELDEESVKRQKLHDDAEKPELQLCLEIVLRDNEPINVESLSTKYPIVDWKTYVLGEDKMYYQIIRADGSEKYYKIFSAMLDDFDRQDVLDLYRMVKERFETASPKGYDILLWRDLITLVKPSEEDEI